MKLYARYLLNKTVFTFAAITTVLILLIWFSRAVAFVKYVTENGVALSQFFYLFVLILPWLLLFITPVSLFAAILLTFNQMLASNEITILKNSGLTKLQICKPIILLSVATSLFCFVISLYLMPYANRELRVSRLNITNNYASLSFNPQTFENLKDLTIYARDRDERNQLFGILIHDERNPQYSLTITAKSGIISLEDKSALLHMEDGTLQRFNYQDQKTEILNFDNYVFNLTENQKSNNTLRLKESELYLPELLNPSEDLDEHERNKYRAEIHRRLTSPLMSIILTLIAASLTLSGQFSRRGNIKNTVFAIIAAAVFLALTTASYNLVETSVNFLPLPYLIHMLFAALGLRMLVSNYRAK